MDNILVELPVDELLLNPMNDRHGQLPENISPIDWMLI